MALTNVERQRFYRRKYPQRRNVARRRNYAKGRVHDRNRGQEWTLHALERIMASDRPSDRELAKELGRSVQAIQVKRTRLNVTL